MVKKGKIKFQKRNPFSVNTTMFEVFFILLHGKEFNVNGIVK